MELQIKTLEDIRACAHTFAETIGDHRIFAFYGSMGSGKTTFIRALCQTLGVQESVTSPTFAIVNEYAVSDGKIFHFDFYRLRNLGEAYDLGFEDYLYSGHLCFIEWPEIVEPLLPDDTVRVYIQQQPDGSRSMRWEEP